MSERLKDQPVFNPEHNKKPNQEFLTGEKAVELNPTDAESGSGRKAEILKVIDQKEEEARKEKAQEAREQVLMIYEEANNSLEYRPIDEMSKGEIGHEYINLLKELSSDFDQSKQGKYGESISSNAAKDGSLLSKYGSEEGELSNLLSTADKIIEAESNWRESGDKIKALEEEIDDLNKKRQSMGLFKRMVTYRSHRRQLDNLQRRQGHIKYREVDANNRQLAANLDEAYSDSHYQNRPNQDVADSRNEEFNQKFFSPDRMDKIDRAIELRKAFEEKK